jgi:hypothetical protein
MRTIYEKAGSDSALIYANQIDVWRQTLAINQKQKTSARFIENRSFSSGTTFESTQEVATKSSASIEFSVYLEESVAGEAGLNIGGVGFSGGVETKWRFDLGSSLSTGITTSRKTGFVLEDDDLGDSFSVDIKADEVYGTPVFKLVSGRSSCPWEPGTQPRDGVDLEIAGDVAQYDVPPGSPAVFTLLLGNTSQSDDTREYHLRLIQATNPDGAIIKIGGVLLEDHLSYYIAPGAREQATLTVERGPRAYDYENIRLMMYPPCQYELWQKNMPIMIADTVTFSVYFANTGSPVTLTVPKENWVIDQNDTHLEYVIKDYNTAVADSIKLQYRRWSDIWQNAKSYAATAISDSIRATLDVSNTTRFPDGSYQLRAAAESAEGINYSRVVAGIIDRNSLIVLDTEPADQILHSGDRICVLFSDRIDETVVSGADKVSLKTVADSVVIEIKVTCADCTLVIEPVTDLTMYAGKYLVAGCCGMKSGNGCIQHKTACWSFKVDEGYTKIDLDALAAVPKHFYLHQNYPNPFNPTTVLEYGVPVAGHVRLSVYNILGQEIMVLVDRMHQPGNYSMVFSVTEGSLAGGVYLYKLEADRFRQIRKLLILK